MTFPDGFDLRFRGSVGFDDRLELWVSLPVRPALLEKLGVKGPLQDYAKVLVGSRVEIPLAGTRLQPRLDLSKVDVKPLIEKAAKSLATEKGGQLLDSLLKQPQKQGK